MSENTRYSVGQVIPVISFEVRRGSYVVSNCIRPRPWEHEITCRNIKQLTCTEHHKVSWRYDEEDKKNCDGFILKDEDGNVIHNQYPRADYGQVDTSADHRFELITYDASGGITDVVHFADLFIFLSDMLRGIYELEKCVAKKIPIEKGMKDFSALSEAFSKRQAQIRIESVRKEYDAIVAEYEKISNKKICVKQAVMTFTDDTKQPEVLEGFWDVYSE